MTPLRGRPNDRVMLENRPHDLESRVGNRVAYGEAARLAEIDRFDHTFGRDAAGRIGGQAEAIEREVMRHIRPGANSEVVKLAVEDALEKRKPRW